MIKVRFETPSLYADHHVIEIRRILFAIPGVVDVYASSRFRIVEVAYDPNQADEKSIADCLAASGYLDPLPVTNEKGGYTLNSGEKISSFRHARMIEPIDPAVNFKQETQQAERAGWPCPGMGLLKPE
jgi:hypothetical protein